MLCSWHQSRLQIVLCITSQDFQKCYKHLPAAGFHHRNKVWATKIQEQLRQAFQVKFEVRFSPNRHTIWIVSSDIGNAPLTHRSGCPLRWSSKTEIVVLNSLTRLVIVCHYSLILNLTSNVLFARFGFLVLKCHLQGRFTIFDKRTACFGEFGFLNPTLGNDDILINQNVTFCT